MTTQRYTVRVTKDYLIFSSGHFITYEGHQCERLHGHNYRVAVEVEGPLDENHYVFDFIALKKRTQEIVEQLDHRMLVATKNPLIHVEAGERSVQVRFKDREWVFPREDCFLLPIANTTAELLATWIARQLADVLRDRYRYVPEVMRVEVEENIGQWAIFEWRPPQV